MPRLPRRAGPLGLAFAAYDVWKRLPPKQRRLVLKQARRYGPVIAGGALRSARALAAARRNRRPR